jgi:O-antigen/teichoic acid export membrane protein
MVVFSFIATIATFSFQTISTHLISPEEYGVLAKWLTDLGFFSMFFVLGLDSSILYHARLGESFEENMGKNFLVYGIILVLSITVVSIFNLNREYYYPLFVSISAFAFINIFKSYFQFNENYILFNVLGIILPLSLVIFFTILSLLEVPLHVYEILNLYSLLSIIVLFLIGIKYFTVSKIRFSKKNIRNTSYYTYGIKSILNKLLALTLYSCTIYLISYLKDSETVAYFFVASGISKLAWVVPDSVGNILFPRFLKIGTEYDKDKIMSEMNRYAQLVFIFNLVSALVFLALGSYLLDLLYSQDYQAIFYPVLILLIGNQGMVFYKIISRYMASINFWTPLYISLSIGIISNIILNLILIPKYGLIGATLATGISFWICGLVISLYLRNSFRNFINVMKLLKS